MSWRRLPSRPLILPDAPLRHHVARMGSTHRRTARKPQMETRRIMTLTDEHGRPVPYVGTGAKDYWSRRTNTYAGCTCPPWRYNPAHPKPTNPNCQQHGSQL